LEKFIRRVPIRSEGEIEVIYSKYCIRAASLLVVLPLILSAQLPQNQIEQNNVVALKNWATPLYWRPNPAEKAAARGPVPLGPPPAAMPMDALIFVAITPCRLVDTRGGLQFNGSITPFDGPSIQPGIPGITTFPVQSPAEAIANTLPAPCGTIPAIAAAYSLNMVVIPHGGLAADYVTIWPAGGTQPIVATLNDYQGGIVGNAAIVGAGSPLGGLSVYSSGPAVIDLVIDMNGYFAAPTDLAGNTGIGAGTLTVNTGTGNTATGASALQLNNSGSGNTANGYQAMQDNTAGGFNTAIGYAALQGNLTGANNMAIGAGALESNTGGSSNTASGDAALQLNTTGQYNTASGVYALGKNLVGNGSTASGYQALYNNTVSSNTAFGFEALEANTLGAGNTASGYQALEANIIGQNNTASGYQALELNTADFNTASGYQALLNNGVGISNTASGAFALTANTSGGENIAIGVQALSSNSLGSSDTATGFQALMNSLANGNTGTGSLALLADTTGQYNTAFGANAGSANVSGNDNIAIGQNAGSMAPTSNSDTIYIGSLGSGSDTPGSIQIGLAAGEAGGTIQIGSAQTGGTFIAGITGGIVTDVGVYVNTTTGRLGITPSSERFKEQITDMGDSSSKLLELRPVNFFYKPEFDNGSHLLQYGLIAEDVAKVYPELVAHDKNGEILSIKYQLLAPMLLNELQKQAAQNLQQAQDIRSLQDRLAALEADLPKATPADR
jgi:hypothetical protein